MRMASLKMLLQDLRHQLEEYLSNKDDAEIPLFAMRMDKRKCKKYKTDELISSIMAQCEEVRDRHAAKAAHDFNDDTVYRGLVTEMLEMKTHAVVKIDWILSQPYVFESDIELAIVSVFRDHICEEERLLKANPSADKALDLCKKYVLVLQHVMEMNAMNENPLIAACADSIADNKLELLLMAGCDVNARTDDDRSSALITSACYGHKSAVQILAARGADVNAGTTNGTTPVSATATNGHTACVELLHKLRADIVKANNDGASPLWRAAARGHVACIKLLHKLGADVNKADADGCTPAYIAA